MWRAWGVLAIVSLASTTQLLQAQAIGARDDFTFIVNVNALQGDDNLAAAQNPVGGNLASAANRALQTHPFKTGTPPVTLIKGYLQHAPHPFRTVTAALTYVRTQFMIPSGGNMLPWHFPIRTSETPRRIQRIVINCAPGLYGPYTVSLNDRIDPKSGLPYNGETFPLSIPEGVSIQGTSALDTIFDGRGRDGYFNHIFDYNVAATLKTKTYTDDFLDSVTIRGARSEAESTPPTGSGIVIRGEGKIEVVISNCIITDNHVGIALDSNLDRSTTVYDSPIIVNNTIAWNQIGIWSGVLQAWASSFSHRGFSRPRLYNNIIDSADPDTQFPTTSCFEGLDPSDLTVRLLGSTSVLLDYNAYEVPLQGNNALYFNLGTVVNPPGWTGTTYYTSPRTTNPTYSPRVNILPYTNTKIPANARKALYINDTFRISMGAPNNITSLSPHDFRLTIHPRATLLDPSVLNPLVNQGVDTSAGSLDFLNNTTASPTPVIVYEPGLKSPGSDSGGFLADFASFHSGDWDMEGYGNLRSENPTGFAGPPQYSTYRDIGADEMANGPKIAGTINGTRTFSMDVPNTSGPSKPTNTNMYFFNLATPGTYPRPNYVSWTGRSWDSTVATPRWFEYVQFAAGTNVPLPGGGTVFNPPTPPTGPSFYTQGQNPSSRYTFVSVPGIGWEPFEKSLECDYTPELLPEISPIWGSWMFNDVFGGNSWYGHNSGLIVHPATGYFRDNPYYYYDPATGYAILYSAPNPPGSYSWNPTTGYLTSLGTQFGPFGYAGGPTYTVNAWGYGDIAGPDVVPYTQWLGVRVCAQNFAWNGTAWVPQDNLQAFLMINGEPTLPAGKSKGFVGTKLTKKQMIDLVKNGRDEVKRRWKNGK